MGYIMAHDFGTSGDKASLFTTEGQFVASNTEAYPTHYSHGTYAEQDPEDWWRAFCNNSKALLAGRDPAEVLCVSFSGTIPNCVCVGSDLRPLGRAIIWQDTRSAAEAEELNDILPPEHLKSLRGGSLNPYATLPKLLWLKKHQPEQFAGIGKVFPSVMEYIILKLTGRAVCDRSTADLTGMMNREWTGWSEEVLDLVGIPASILPELCERTDIVGEVPERYASECGLPPGCKLVMGTADSQCSNIGAGLLNEGDIYCNGGTSAGIFALGPGGRRLGGHTTSSGASFNWLKETVCTEEQRIARETGRNVYDVICEQIDRSPAGAHGVMFHPYLAGERTPRNNPGAKGSFVGLTLAATRNDLMRSVIEGIGMNLNVILQSIRDQGYEIRRMPIIGGLGKNPVVRQIFADIMDVELVTFEYMDEVTSVGAAVLGGIALGLYEDESAVKNFMKVDTVTRPNADRHRIYQERAGLFEQVYEAQRPIYERMENCAV